VRFLAGAMPGSDDSTVTVVCHRRIVVLDGLMEAVTLFQDNFSSTTRVWVSESILRVGTDSFQERNKLHLICFESNSRLMRIESNAFSFSSLRSIMIPSQVQSINGSAFAGANLSNSLIERDNRRFIFENAFLLDVVDHKWIRTFFGLSHIAIPHDIKSLRSS
jgi:hypothetical protein